MAKYLILFITLVIGFSSGKPDGQRLFEANCLRCHGEDSQKPLSYIKSTYRGKPEEIKKLSKQCPWGKHLSEKEIDLISRWLAGVK